MKLDLPQCKIRYFVFILYNFLYVTYMLGYTSQTYYLGTLILFCLMNLFMIVKKGGILKKALREFKLGMGYVLVFFIISIVIQIYNMDFQSYLYSGLLRISLPILNAFLFVNSVDSKDYKYFFNVLLARFALNFVWEFYKDFNFAGLLSISWSESSSSMESSMAHDFIVMEVYFLSRKDNKKAFVSMLLCMLSMKRLSFILAPILFVLAKKLPEINKPVKKSLLRSLKIVAILSPFFMFALYSKASQNFFQNVFNMDLNLKMGGRIAIYDTVVNNIPYFNGYGSINAFLSKFVYSVFGTYWNATLHNDFIRIYYETTIVGVVVLANNLVELSKKNYWNFIIVAYLIFVGITSHILNYFSVWVTFYMIIICTQKESDENKELENKMER